MTMNELINDLRLSRPTDTSEQQHLITEDRHMPENFENMLALATGEEMRVGGCEGLLRKSQLGTKALHQCPAVVCLIHG
jgi:hypothetical protein